MGFNIAVATPEDIALLEKYMPVGDVPDAHQKRFSLQNEGKGLYLLALHESVSVGYVMLHYQNPYEASRKLYPDFAYVEGLSTDADHQRQGIATSLMQNLELHAKQRGAQNVGLYVGVDNLPARSLYRKLSYKPTSLPPYLVMWKALNQTTGELEEDGETCDFWIKALD